MFWFFGCEAYGILAPRPGIEPSPPVLEGEVLTTGPPGKSQRPPYILCPGTHSLHLVPSSGPGELSSVGLQESEGIQT